jgi:hypothetical protein
MTAPAPDLDALIERLRDPTYDGDALHRIAAATALVQLREENANLRNKIKASGRQQLREELGAERDRHKRTAERVAALEVENTRLQNCESEVVTMLRAENDALAKDAARYMLLSDVRGKRLTEFTDALLEVFECYDKGGTLSEEAYAVIDAAKEGNK